MILDAETIRINETDRSPVKHLVYIDGKHTSMRMSHAGLHFDLARHKRKYRHEFAVLHKLSIISAFSIASV